jgi:hypothetical protein
MTKTAGTSLKKRAVRKFSFCLFMNHSRSQKCDVILVKADYFGHAREGGHPKNFESLMDSRFRGNDKAQYNSHPKQV